MHMMHARHAAGYLHLLPAGLSGRSCGRTGIASMSALCPATQVLTAAAELPTANARVVCSTQS